MTKIEQVALAIWQARMGTTDGVEIFTRLDARSDWIACARAAINAMRDPTPAMIDAAEYRFDVSCGHENAWVDKETCGSIFNGMIDAMINEKDLQA